CFLLPAYLFDGRALLFFAPYSHCSLQLGCEYLAPLQGDSAICADIERTCLMDVMEYRRGH
ncbi:hypothetical protein, partial [Aeromonas allosaccharophila]|uniref:hypothetical protein n=1 Tax=Aeromonas allosaccharophila TaxID=656 RepID=UPI001E44C8C9